MDRLEVMIGRVQVSFLKLNNTIALQPGSRILACGGESEYLSFCDFKSEDWTVGGIAHSLPVRQVTWTPDGKYLLSAADDGLCLWKL